ncbi:MAG: SPOR domain-containing protein, partial [Treponema sp.]|nr:SPOR domain-containing protein [Treponema sp.]
EGDEEGSEEDKPEENIKPEEEYKPIILEKEETPEEEKRPEVPLTGIFKNESDLVSGKYYVQIATVVEAEEAEALARKHSQYPILAIPGASGKGWRVLVGPLGLDEYGAVLEKFRDAGYRDAFTRRIK